jgi:histidinol-phosphatase (PHP family)
MKITDLIPLKSDIHSHSTFSDGKNSMEEMVLAAIDNGLEVYGLSDHSPTPFPAFWAMKDDRIGEYLTEGRRLQKKYEAKIKILIGMEVDYFPDYENHLSRLPLDELDYVIGSVHFLPIKNTDGHYIGMDLSKEMFSEAIKKIGGIEKTVELYYQTMKRATSINEFSLMGHYDVIKKFNHGNFFFNEQESWYVEYVRNALEATSKNQKAVEINISAKRRGLDDFYPSSAFCEYARTLNIPLLRTSDAHNVNDLLVFK